MRKEVTFSITGWLHLGRCLSQSHQVNKLGAIAKDILTLGRLGQFDYITITVTATTRLRSTQIAIIQLQYLQKESSQ